MPKTIALPSKLSDLFSDPQRVRDAVALLNALAQMQAKLVPPSGSASLGTGRALLVGDSPIMLQLPFRFAAAVAAPASTVGSAVASTGATNASPFGYTTAGQANAIVTLLNQCRADILALQTAVTGLTQQLSNIGFNQS